MQFRRQAREKAGAERGESGGLIPLEGSLGSRRGSAAEGPVAEDALGKLLLGLLKAGPRPAVQGVHLGKEAVVRGTPSRPARTQAHLTSYPEPWRKLLDLWRPRRPKCYSDEHPYDEGRREVSVSLD